VRVSAGDVCAYVCLCEYTPTYAACVYVSVCARVVQLIRVIRLIGYYGYLVIRAIGLFGSLRA
jgi:hypothetical protein